MALWETVDLDADPYEPRRYLGDPAEVIDAWGELLALLERPWWHQHAACRGHAVQTFFPERGASAEPARDVCASCTVVDECTAAGLREHTGIWGGTSERQRRAARRSAA